MTTNIKTAKKNVIQAQKKWYGKNLLPKDIESDWFDEYLEARMKD